MHVRMTGEQEMRVVLGGTRDSCGLQSSVSATEAAAAAAVLYGTSSALPTDDVCCTNQNNRQFS